MLVTISPKWRRRAKTLRDAKYEKHVPYKPYQPYGSPDHTYAKKQEPAPNPYAAYKPYQPYGHPEHTYNRARATQHQDQPQTVEQLLRECKFALPEYTVVTAITGNTGNTIIDIDPNNAEDFFNVLDNQGFAYTYDQAEMPMSCKNCGHPYTIDESRKGVCPHCKVPIPRPSLG